MASQSGSSGSHLWVSNELSTWIVRKMQKFTAGSYEFEVAITKGQLRNECMRIRQYLEYPNLSSKFTVCLFRSPALQTVQVLTMKTRNMHSCADLLV